MIISIYQEGGVVRRFVNLIDYITQKNLKIKDGSFCQSETKDVAKKISRDNNQSLNIFFLIKRDDYIR